MPMREPVSIWDDPYRHEPDQIPPDPLLGSDAFIATATNDCENQNGDVNQTEQTTQFEPPPLSKEEQSKRPAAETTETPPSRRTRKSPDEMERPDWLPEGWKMTCKVRTNGASAGSTDRYYVDPTSGHRFRSKIEVLRFLETGSKKRPTTDANDKHSETPGGRKEKKKSGSKSKKPAPWTFDFQNPPEEVNWALMDVSQGLWKPSIAEKQVPESSRQEWTAAFEHICGMNTST